MGGRPAPGSPAPQNPPTAISKLAMMVPGPAWYGSHAGSARQFLTAIHTGSPAKGPILNRGTADPRISAECSGRDGCPEEAYPSAGRRRGDSGPSADDSGQGDRTVRPSWSTGWRRSRHLAPAGNASACA